MRKFISSLTSLFLLLSSSTATRAWAADSYKIFIDLDNSPNEIDAAVEGAKPENIIVIPHRSDAEKAILKELYETEKLIEAGKSSEMPVLMKKKSFLLTKVKSFLGPLPVSSKSISDELSQTIAKYQPVTSLIVSGHHVDGAFSGDLGKITDVGLGAALIANSDKIKSLRSFYGMGCYTATVEAAKEFQSFTPHLVEVGGYNPQGYTRFDPMDAPYLKSSLKIEHDLLKAFDEKKNQAELDAIIHSAIFKYKNAAICMCHICTSNIFGDVDVDEVMNSCSVEALGSISTRVQSYWDMMDPSSTDNEVYCNTASSPLRDLYTDVKNHAHCATADISFRDSFAPFTQTAPGLIRMVHFQNIVSNFARYNEKDLMSLKALSKTENFPMINLKSAMECIGSDSPKSKTDRGALIQWINSLPDIPSISPLKSRMLRQLTYLKCVPADWINTPDLSEPVAPPPPCCLEEDKDTPSCAKK